MRYLAILIVVLPSVALVSADGPPPRAKTPIVVKDWKADPACRLVFFAVFQGLYEDGVSMEVVNNIVPPGLKDREQMRHSFVLDCPLCQPAYEAFRVYQARPRFLGSDAPAMLGKGLDKTEMAGLLNKEVSTRLITLRTSIRRWVERRLVMMKVDEAGREKWWNDINDRANQGTSTLRGLIKTDPNYKDWSGYWGCAACLGSKDACHNLRPAKAP